ncbi:MAG: Asd/ArgC dimerization domain-containing protein, partial [Planctomycetota bacterium]
APPAAAANIVARIPRLTGMMCGTKVSRIAAPEMEQELTAATGAAIRLTFVPHIIPVNRGILSTMFAAAAGGADRAALHGALAEAYAAEPFVRVREAGANVCLANVRGTNYCDVGVERQEETGAVVIISAIDNMLKGACSQAIQNMNLMFGLDESAGIGGVRGS